MLRGEGSAPLGALGKGCHGPRGAGRAAVLGGEPSIRVGGTAGAASRPGAAAVERPGTRSSAAWAGELGWSCGGEAARVWGQARQGASFGSLRSGGGRWEEGGGESGGSGVAGTR